MKQFAPRTPRFLGQVDLFCLKAWFRAETEMLCGIRRAPGSVLSISLRFGLLFRGQNWLYWELWRSRYLWEWLLTNALQAPWGEDSASLATLSASTANQTAWRKCRHGSLQAKTASSLRPASLHLALLAATQLQPSTFPTFRCSPDTSRYSNLAFKWYYYFPISIIATILIILVIIIIIQFASKSWFLIH